MVVWRSLGFLAGLALAVALAPGLAAAGQVAVAVATNFAKPLEALVAEFKARTGHDVIISSGSTGKLYAQIEAGAPFDVFLAADAARPAKLADEGFADPASRFTYALGRLVLLSRGPAAAGRDCLEVLRASTGKVAIANPATAPYGAAAKKTLQALGLWDQVEARIVQGEDIGQTFAFIDTGNAEIGFVAASQVAAEPADGATGCRWEVTQDLHAPIEQQAVLLARGEGNPAAAAFVEFLRSPEAAKTIGAFGYGTVQ
ncbi:MAG: molybdate ABC transporter substrate-binding protein [Alphaproteobacteria bacterium]